jgi:hypothetical protein
MRTGQVDQTLAGVVFTKFPLHAASAPGGSSFEYKLRFPSKLRSSKKGSSTNPFSNNNNWFTRFMFPQFQKVGPRENSSIQGGPPGKSS